MPLLPQRLPLPLLTAVACAMSLAVPWARADALAEVRIVQVQLAPNGSFTEIGDPLVVRSFSSGVVESDIDFFGVDFSVGPRQALSWDFAYTVSMRADGLPLSGISAPSVCVPETGGPCSPPVGGGQSLAWTFFTIGSIDPRSRPPFGESSGGRRFQLELRDGSFEESGLVSFSVGSSSDISAWNNGRFAVGAVTFAAAIPEPATYVQMAIGLGLLAGAFGRRSSLATKSETRKRQRRAASDLGL